MRFNFPYVERGVTSPDPRPVLEHTFVRVYEHVVSELAEPGVPVFIGGKSLGGRAACELVSRQIDGSGLAPAGLIILGYPLHRPGHKEQLFLSPLRHVDVPSLFCIGSRDTLCDPKMLAPVLARPGHTRRPLRRRWRRPLPAPAALGRPAARGQLRAGHPADSRLHAANSRHGLRPSGPGPRRPEPAPAKPARPRITGLEAPVPPDTQASSRSRGGRWCSRRRSGRSRGWCATPARRIPR